MYCFRHRFRIPQVGKLSFDEPRVALSGHDGEGPRVWIGSTSDAPLRETDRVALRGEGYESERDAAAAADFWRGVLMRSFAAVNVGVDFGDRAPQGGMSQAYRDEMEARFGQPFLDDVHGLITFPCAPDPVFVGLSAAGFAPLAQEHWQRALAAAVHEAPLTATGRLAYDLYGAAAFVADQPDARFMMLMMALETLITQNDRSRDVREHVDSLIAATRQSSLPDAEKTSLEGSLRWMYVESISQAGRRLAGTLGDRLYGGREPHRFFRDCYRLRSELAHGHVPRPNRQEVGVMAAQLAYFVGDLLAGPIVVEAAGR